MKQQYLRLFAFIFGLAFIISGVIFTFTKMYKDDREKKVEEEKVIADEIGDIYKIFFEKENEVNAYRDTLLKDFGDYVTFYANMPKKYDKMAEKIKQYETLITEVEDVSSYLKDKCVEKYSVSEANDKCIAYYINLERTINYYVGDHEYFNSKIKEFNEWIVGENKSVLMNAVKYKELKEFVSEKYTKYVDLNKDGTYLGQNAD